MNKLLALGIGGSVLAGLCCVTPLLPIVLSALGLGGLIGFVYSDSVLFPVLAGFLLMTGFVLWRRRQPK